MIKVCKSNMESCPLPFFSNRNLGFHASFQYGSFLWSQRFPLLWSTTRLVPASWITQPPHEKMPSMSPPCVRWQNLTLHTSTKGLYSWERGSSFWWVLLNRLSLIICIKHCHLTWLSKHRYHWSPFLLSISSSCFTWRGIVVKEETWVSHGRIHKEDGISSAIRMESYFWVKSEP